MLLTCVSEARSSRYLRKVSSAGPGPALAGSLSPAWAASSLSSRAMSSAMSFAFFDSALSLGWLAFLPSISTGVSASSRLQGGDAFSAVVSASMTLRQGVPVPARHEVRIRESHAGADASRVLEVPAPLPR